MSKTVDATLICWRDIPTQISLGKGRRAAKKQLSDRFMVAVDKAAMQAGASNADDYLDDWVRHEASYSIDDDAEAINAIAEQIEQTYPTSRLAELARNGGYEPDETRQ